MNRTEPTHLLIATRNRGKLREFQELLADLPVKLLSLDDFPFIPEVEETGETFTENALLKAQAYSAQTGHWTLADDSGLEVDALGGAPGVYSARYAGVAANDERRRAKLLLELSRTSGEERRARFICVIALVDSTGLQAQTFDGVCEGWIASEPKGTEGFGYDPIFVPDGYDKTFGELMPTTKKEISHRAQASKAVHTFLLNLLSRPRLTRLETGS